MHPSVFCTFLKNMFMNQYGQDHRGSACLWETEKRASKTVTLLVRRLQASKHQETSCSPIGVKPTCVVQQGLADWHRIAHAHLGLRIPFLDLGGSCFKCQRISKIKVSSNLCHCAFQCSCEPCSCSAPLSPLLSAIASPTQDQT